jgi:hypothetical protein
VIASDRAPSTRARARALPAHEEDRETIGVSGSGDTNGVNLDVPGNLIVLDFRIRHHERLTLRERGRRR